jgi:LytS/YehU family sensor histidine kinase
MILGAFYGVDAYRRWQEEQLRAERLNAQLQEAKLQALKMQLHPHFLFNTLQTISALIPRDPKRAEELIERLGQLLRTALELGDQPFVALNEELAFVERYLDIQTSSLGRKDKGALGDRAAARDAHVPAFVLQPLVENAIKHGIAPRAEPGSVAVGAHVSEDGNKLALWVQDDGPGLNGRLQEGHGLRNLRERLQTLYGSEAKLELQNGARGGLRAVIEISLRSAS